MIDIEVLVLRETGLRRQDLERWISNEWVRPERSAGHMVFDDIDVARVRLIRELRDDLAIDEEALPLVLSLLDQIYDLRRRMRRLVDTLGAGATNRGPGHDDEPPPAFLR